MADIEAIATRTKQLIQEYVEEHWGNTQTVCYHSSIGSYLNRVAPESRAALPKGLGEFLRQNPVVHVVQFPGVAQKIGAVPLSVALPENITELFLRNTPTPEMENRNVYLQNFWEAFIHPIEGNSRYILVDEANRIIVHDGPLDHANSEAYEIQLQDLTNSIPDGSIADKVKATHTAIDAWLKKHSLDSAVFLRPRIRKQDFAVSDRLTKFLSAFDGLSSDDLARIEIPLDILFKLTSKQ